jgi:hypothetical protein
MNSRSVFFILILLLPFLWISSEGQEKVSLKQSFSEVLSELDSALLSLQNVNETSSDYGAIWCSHCKLYHTRAAETVYPFAYEFSISDNSAYREAAIRLGNWLIKQQFADGSWKETPEEWTGTSTDQLLMMAQAYPILEKYLSEEERRLWLKSMTMAGDYLTLTMSPDFASINYVATTTATLMVLNEIVPDEKYTKRAKVLAKQTIAKMDDDLFITGEGGRVFGAKYGVDLAYNMEMSLWGLGLYATLSGDDLVMDKVLKSTQNHLQFIFPDGSLDGSWGIRSNKWTCFGGATSDGTQVLFSLLAEHDDRYRTAALRNLNYLKTCMKDGLIGYGPQHWEVMRDEPCIYSTFAKAKNLAMAHALLKNDSGSFPDLPSDQNGLKVFPTLNIANVRTDNICATVTAYGYKDPKGNKSKYMFRPTGGAISNLWLKDYGFLQASSQTEYHRWEPMHFPEAENLECLTPRIEFQNSNGYFTNLFEFDATASFLEEKQGAKINVFGELKNRDQQPGGIGYSYEYEFRDKSVTKKIHFRYHSNQDTLLIIEPVIQYNNVEIVQINDKTVSIKAGKQTVLFELHKGNAKLTSGEDHENYWSPYPALKAWPIVLTLYPDENNIEEEISYSFTIQ